MPPLLPLLKILIVEDDEDDFFFMNEHLKKIATWEFEVRWIPSYENAVQALCTNNFTICFSDYRLGVKNGIDLIKEAVAKNTTTPIILLTGRGTHKIDLEATAAGAFDYLVKDELDADKLERTIRYTLERKATLEKLQESERKYRSFFEKSKDIVFIARPDLTITAINDTVRELLGISVQGCIEKKKLTDFFRDESSRSLFTAQLNKLGEVENFEVILAGNQEETITGLVNAAYDDNGNNEAYIQGIIHDITALKTAETIAIQHEKLAATKKFIHTLAHEVRNPLKNIKMAVTQLLNPQNKVDNKMLLDIVERSEVKIDNLITELLQGANTVTFKKQPVSFLKVLQHVLASVEDKVLLRHVNLIADIAAADINLEADAVKLEMAILNIVVNAIEAVVVDTGMIEVWVSREEGILVLSIKDNGSGISPEHTEKLFEPYFTSKDTGIGLGLATTKDILTAHDATIEVASVMGEGSVFRVLFRLNESINS